jgi:hypothetical protein
MPGLTFLPLFTGVRRSGILRSWTSALRSSPQFASTIGTAVRATPHARS